MSKANIESRDCEELYKWYLYDDDIYAFNIQYYM